MKKEHIINDIRDVLQNKMALSHITDFHPEARFNQDLYLDSVQFLQLLLNLELEKGYEIPEDALSSEAFASVSSLAEYLCHRQTVELAND